MKKLHAKNDLWERIGSLEGDEPTHILTRLYTVYDDILKANPEDEAALQFFSNLEQVINFCTECNLNRR